ncbi:MAG: hypothetical protein ACOYKM_08755 [Caulobacterales bacterium]
MTTRQTQKQPTGQQRRLRAVIWTFAGAALLAMPLGALAGWHAVQPIPALVDHPWLAALAAALVLSGAIGLTLYYWRSIDELARQAHLSAWMWGGSIGMAVGVFMLSFSTTLPGPLRAGIAGDPGDDLLFRGGMIVAGAALLGYGLVWIWFWLRRR